MKIVVAPDSFKGSLSAPAVAQAMADGVAAVLGRQASVEVVPMADGGEGTLSALARAGRLSLHRLITVDAIGRPTTGRIGLSSDRRLAVIEVAEACGLTKVADVAPQPLRADTFGVGVLVREAIAMGVSEVLICLGGTATSDYGTGLMRALGARFLAKDGKELPSGGGALERIHSVDVSAVAPQARRIIWRVAVDVDNPLLGDNGAAVTYAAQKGASGADIDVLERGGERLAEVLRIDPATPGLGAAGGLPLAFSALFDAPMEPGAMMVARIVRLPQAIVEADLVITGEGSFDAQSLRGKVVHAVRALAPVATPVAVVAGRVGLTFAEVRRAGLLCATSIADGPSTLDYLTLTAETRVRETTANVVAAFAAGSRRASPRAAADRQEMTLRGTPHDPHAHSRRGRTHSRARGRH